MGLGAEYGRLPAREAPAGSRAGRRIAARERALKATVARLRGCLGELPDSQRELLELRTGLTGGTPLSPRTAAARLRIGGARFARLEAQAVRELGGLASTSGCARLPEIVAGVASYLSATFGGTQAGGARAGVEAARYEAAASATGPISVPTSASSSHGLLGTNIPPVAGGVILLLLALLAAALVVSAVLADAAGQGPRHRHWRARMIERFNPKR